MGALWNFVKWLPGALMALLMFGAGVGPKDAVSHLAEWASLVGIEVPSWLAGKSADKWAFVVGLVGFVIWGITLWIRSKNSKRRAVVVNEEPHKKAGVLPSGYISMKDAARKLYEAAKAGKIPFGEASERLSGLSGYELTRGSPEDILHWWAGDISKKLPIYGIRPPSSIFEEIPQSDVRHFIFCEEATKLKDPIHDSIYYTNVAVRLDALDIQYNFEAGYHG